MHLLSPRFHPLLNIVIFLLLFFFSNSFKFFTNNLFILFIFIRYLSFALFFSFPLAFESLRRESEFFCLFLIIPFFCSFFSFSLSTFPYPISSYFASNGGLFQSTSFCSITSNCKLFSIGCVFESISTMKHRERYRVATARNFYEIGKFTSISFQSIRLSIDCNSRFWTDAPDDRFESQIGLDDEQGNNQRTSSSFFRHSLSLSVILFSRYVYDDL